MSREEDAVRATTRAIAATVREVPPLELTPAPGELWSPRRGTRRTRRRGSGSRWLPWLAPLAAAAVVVAVAVALVLVRGNPNEGAVPQPAPTGALPGGVPRYYVAVHPVRGSNGEVNHLLVGDALTGQTIDDIAPPAHVSYASVTAAADDRTFLAFATQSGATGSGGSQTTGRWYILRLAPGTENVVELSSTALLPESGVVASALSASGRYLAVAEDGPPKGLQRVIVFSVATGRPLRVWSTNDAPDLWALGVTSQQNLLTWIDGDRAIAFAAFDQATGAQSMRTLDVGGPPGGDLIADSRLIWSTSASTPAQCGFTPPVLSADGRTIACVTNDIRPLTTGDSQWTITWFAARASAQAPAADNYTIAYQVIRQAKIAGVGAGMNFAGLADALWVSPSGSALIGEWAIAANPQDTTSTSSSSGSSSSASATLRLGVSAGSVHVGVISHGTFTPLWLPLDILPLSAQAIAW
jgi:hypothetical protein